MLGLSQRKGFFEGWPYGNAPPAAPAPAQSPEDAGVPVFAVTQLPDANYQFRSYDGSKFADGFGPTLILETDYWTLRLRSAQLYKTNLYARGIIRRMVTNEINSGLELEATPEEGILGLEKGILDEWTEDVENRFSLWASTPWACDAKECRTFGQLQAIARLEALVVGDVLVTLQQDQRTGLPRVKLISGAAVQTPFGVMPKDGHRIVHGVELDPQGRQVAYWVQQQGVSVTAQNAFKRLPAYGEKTGRRLAWLLYGTDKRLDDVRGEPILSLVLQSLREIDRYRDSIQRKAVVNSLLALFIKKTADKPGSKPFTAGALRKGTQTVVDTTGTPRTYAIQEQMPGMVIDELQTGEEPVAFRAQVGDEKFGEFEAVIIQAIAWGLEMPPEILRLSFTHNYSSSQAAINEYKLYLHPVRAFFGSSFCQPVYEDWFVSAALRNRVEARGFIDAWRDPSQFETSAAWLRADWSGHIKPSVKLTDVIAAYKEMVDEGFITRDRATRETTGTKFSKNVKRLLLENTQLAAARKPLLEVEAQAKPKPEPQRPPEDSDSEDEDEDEDDAEGDEDREDDE